MVFGVVFLISLTGIVGTIVCDSWVHWMYSRNSIPKPQMKVRMKGVFFGIDDLFATLVAIQVLIATLVLLAVK